MSAEKAEGEARREEAIAFIRRYFSDPDGMGYDVDDEQAEDALDSIMGIMNPQYRIGLRGQP